MLPLIGLAHGSRDPRAAATIAEVMRAVAALRPGLVTVPAFLDLSEPDLLTAARALAADREGGDASEEAIVLPLLFTQAFHARVDAPTAVRDATAETGLRLHLGAILGMGEAVLDALAASAAAAGVRAEDEVVLLAVGSSDDAANRAVHDLAARWTARRGGIAVSAGFATSGQPQAAELLASAAAAGRPAPAVVPLFLAPGLLLDAIAAKASDVGSLVAAPLGTALVGLVLQRYDEAVEALETLVTSDAGSGTLLP